MIVADNLAANSIGGLVESFNSNVSGYCRYCVANKTEIQTKFLERELTKRVDFSQNNTQYVTQPGFKQDCVFNNLRFFNRRRSLLQFWLINGCN